MNRDREAILGQRAQWLALAKLARQAGRRPVLDYRCGVRRPSSAGCLLLAVYKLADGSHLLYRPATRVSQKHADQTGQRGTRLPEYAEPLDVLAAHAGDSSVSGLTECRHLSMKRVVLTVARIRGDLAAGRTRIELGDTPQQHQ